MEDGQIRALALDQAMRRTGWAVGSPDMVKPIHGVFDMPSWGREEGKRIVQFRGFLESMVAEHRITHIFYEQIIKGAFSGITQIRAKCMLEGKINEFCEDNDIPVADVPMGSWRSRLIGTSVAPPHIRAQRKIGPDGKPKRDGASTAWFKQEVRQACLEMGFGDIEDHNEAEACGILHYGLGDLCRRYRGRTDVIFRRKEYRQDNQRNVI